MSPTTRRSGSPRLAGGRNPLRRSPPRRIRLNSCRPPRDVRLSVRRSPERTTSRGPPPQPCCRHARTRCPRGNAYRDLPLEPGIPCSAGHTRGPPKLASPARRTRVAGSRTRRRTIPSGTVVSFDVYGGLTISPCRTRTSVALRGKSLRIRHRQRGCALRLSTTHPPESDLPRGLRCVRPERVGGPATDQNLSPRDPVRPTLPSGPEEFPRSHALGHRQRFGT